MGYCDKLSTFHLLNLLILSHRSHFGATFLGQKCTKNQCIKNRYNLQIINKIIII